MTKTEALHSFWASFGIPAYDEQGVQSGASAPNFPYIAYQSVTDSFGNDIALTGNIWYRTSSWTEPNAKVEDISQSIGRSGKIVEYNGGAIWLRRGTPFAQSLGDPSDDRIKRKLLNITATFISEN